MSTTTNVSADQPDSLVTIIELNDIGPRFGMATIGTLSDEIFLEVFAWCLDDADEMDAWHPLVHVCQRWRQLVFASARRLSLRLRCIPRRSVKKMLRIWPALPISIWDFQVHNIEDLDNIIAALEHRDRVCEIILGDISSSKLKALVSAMLKPFPRLEYLAIEPLADESVSVIPDLFLGGSAPLLQSLSLDSISFPALPKLLLSARNLVNLFLYAIPKSGVISPEVMATCLSTMSTLQRLQLEFRSTQSHPDQEGRHLPLPRYILPALTQLRFRGSCEYLEDLLVRIDAPVIHSLHITFISRPFVFHISQLRQLIDRSEKFKSLTHSTINLRDCCVSVRLYSPAGTPTYDRARLSFEVLCSELYPQLRSLAQVGRFALLPLSNMESLEISSEYHIKLPHRDATVDNPWPKVLSPFSAAKNLYLSKNVVTPVASALREVIEERMTKVLPALQNLSIGGSSHSKSVQNDIEHFLAARRLSEDPVRTYSRANTDDGGIFSAFHH